MKIFDISVSLTNDLAAFPGDPPVRIEPLTGIAEGGAANISLITLSSHSGTHLDPPRHFNDHGASSDQIPLSALMGPALVIETEGVKAISAYDLERFPLKGEKRVLLKTGNSLLWDLPGFRGEYAHLSEDGARFLVESGVELLGIDYLSVERSDGDGSVHRLLLQGGVIILEGLDLNGVPCGRYELLCLPLKIAGGDGAPARAILISE